LTFTGWETVAGGVPGFFFKIIKQTFNLIKHLFSFALAIDIMSYSEKQLEIIEAAEKLFSERGFAGTSVREIADSAGVNVAMISYYFTSKEKLMEAIFTNRTIRVTEKLERVLHDDQLQPIEKLEGLVDDYISKLIDKHKFYKLMYFEQMLDQNPAIRDLLQQLKRKNAELIGKIVSEGQARNAFRPDIDVILLINSIVGTIMHSFMNREQYRLLNHMTQLSDDEFLEEFKLRLRQHMKQLIKLTVLHEA
jgi:AcrR family transcriptional regulator